VLIEIPHQAIHDCEPGWLGFRDKLTLMQKVPQLCCRAQ
jgi:hypothetical protein